MAQNCVINGLLEECISQRKWPIGIVCDGTGNLVWINGWSWSHDMSVKYKWNLTLSFLILSGKMNGISGNLRAFGSH